MAPMMYTGLRPLPAVADYDLPAPNQSLPTSDRRGALRVLWVRADHTQRCYTLLASDRHGEEL